MRGSLADRLDRLQNSLRTPPAESKAKAQAPMADGQPAGVSAESRSSDVSRDRPWQHVLSQMGFAPVDVVGESVWKRTVSYDVFCSHGQYTFHHLAEADVSGLQHLLGHPVSPCDLRFFDTETLGLGSGAGNIVFLYTVGQLVADEVCFEQYFLVDPAGELLFLQHLDGCFSESAIWVTFNGKSFDLPMIQSRRTMHRLSPLRIRPHLDLLHPLRRIFKATLPSVSLGCLEEKVLRLERLDDVSGREAPLRYLKFITDKDVRGVTPVLQHNLMDVASLVVLCAYLADFTSSRATVQTASESLTLARWYEAWKNVEGAAECYRMARALDDLDGYSLWMESLFQKRQGRWLQSVELWKELSRLQEASVAPLLELAKWAEHVAKDLPLALSYANEAYERALQQELSDGRKSSIQLPYRVSSPGRDKVAEASHDFWQELQSCDLQSFDSQSSNPVLRDFVKRIRRIEGKIAKQEHRGQEEEVDG